MLFAYLIYFAMITHKALETIKNLRKTYRAALGTTLFVMGVSVFIMLRNGQASQRIDFELFWSLYSLFNLYLYFMAYLYAPA